MSVTTTFRDLILDKAANDTAADFIRSKISELVDDPEVARVLTPTDHPFATKRPCHGLLRDVQPRQRHPGRPAADADHRDRPLRHPHHRRRSRAGLHRLRHRVRRHDRAPVARRHPGPGGRPLSDKWSAGPRTYLGIATAGFPNLFILTGPGSPSVLSNMVMAIEQHVDWIADCLSFMAANELDTIEATVDAEDAWVDHVNQLANATLFPRANSWYMGANVPGKPRLPALRRRLPAVSLHL